MHYAARARQNNLFGRRKLANHFASVDRRVAVSGTFDIAYSTPDISEEMVDGAYADSSYHVMARASGGPRWPVLKSRVVYYR
jgi:hypothetical protein